MISFTRGVPANEAFPLDELLSCSESAIQNFGAKIFQYSSSFGFQPLRELLSEEYGVSPDQIILSHGALQILDFTSSCFLGEGSSALVELPTYDRAIQVLKRSKATVMGVPLEDDGIDLKALKEKTASFKPRLIYLIPDFQNPSGTTMSLKKREKVAELAREFDFLIVEDIPYRKLRFQGNELPQIRDFCPERTITLSSFSKLISPGLRVGFAFGPSEIISRIALQAEETYITPSLLPQALVFEFLKRGNLPGQIKKLHSLYFPRLEVMLDSLRENFSGMGDWIKPEGGFFVGLTLKKKVEAPLLLSRAKEAGVLLTDGRGFFADGGGDNFLRLPFCALKPEEIREGIGILARLIKEM
ncbi:MAG: PLP-dependent aminotransferase family protein [Caldiserica bacterium]|jgi:2-aminoadipate transaminase|nr:PLP-dependent aminotransferase family protein [Caldisericota bacterium]MDH7562365.1 PLP-dependent aminotransferase family protein [Caldisericota bacterium]